MAYSDRQKQREFQREWLQRRRNDWLDENGPCQHCGSTDQLEVHHLDPKQKVEHRIWSWATDRREAELGKCEVLCRPCHIATFAPPKLHTRATYNRGCRCDKCRAANRDRRRVWTARQRSADGGSRTRTGLSPDVFETSASSVPPRRLTDDTTEEAS
jgi:hypothetical protein